MARIAAGTRAKLPDSAFADPANRKFLILDKTHAELAWRMLDRASWPSATAKATARRRILAALKRFGVDVSGYASKPHKLSLSDVEQLSLDQLSAMEGLLECDLADAMDEKLAMIRQRHVSHARGNHHAYAVAMAEYARPILMDSRGVVGMHDLPTDEELQAVEAFKTHDEEVKDLYPAKKLLKVPVARLGVWHHKRYGLVSFSQQDFDDIVRNFEKDELGFPPYLRYGHDVGKRPGVVDDDVQQGPIIALAQEGAVLFAYVDPANDQVVSDIRTRKMRFASAEIFRNAESKRDGSGIGTILKALSLTNAPFVPNLPEAEVLSHQDADVDDAGFFVLELSETAAVEKEQATMTTEATPAAPAAGEDVKLSFLDKALGRVEQFFTTIMGAVPTEGAVPAVPAATPETPAESAQDDTPAAETEGAEPRLLNEDELRTKANSEPAGDTTPKNAEPGSGTNETGEDQASEPPVISAADTEGDGATQQSDETADTVDEGQAQAEPETPAETSESQTTDNSQKETTMSDTPNAQGVTLEQLSAQIGQVVEQNSTLLAQLAAKDAEIASMRTQLQLTAGQAQAFSNMIVENKRASLKSSLLAEGIPPATVEMAFSFAAAMPQEVKLSADGADADPFDAMAALCRTLPAESRVRFQQFGHQLTGDAVNAANPLGEYDGIVKGMLGQSA